MPTMPAAKPVSVVPGAAPTAVPNGVTESGVMVATAGVAVLDELRPTVPCAVATPVRVKAKTLLAKVSGTTIDGRSLRRPTPQPCGGMFRTTASTGCSVHRCDLRFLLTESAPTVGYLRRS